MDFLIGHLRSGDIIFVKPAGSKKSKHVVQKLNISGQRILAALRRNGRIGFGSKYPGHSHVMLGLDGGNIIHADGKTVTLEGVETALQFGSDDAWDFSIFRRKDLAPDIAAKIAVEASRYLEQRYSFSQYRRTQLVPESENSTQFCSRLVAMAYRVAGLPLTDLPDQRVLPLDLWRICNGKDWSDVTAEFVNDVDWSLIGEVLGPVELPGEGTVDLATFMANADRLSRNVAAIAREITSQERESASRIVRTEALMAQYAIGLLDLAKAARVNPLSINSDFAARICRVLEQLRPLMELAALQDIEEILTSMPIALGADADRDRGAYAGLPAHSEIMKLRARREELLTMSYLLMAETGLACVCAHTMDFEEFALFRSVDDVYVQRFLAALPPNETSLSPIKDSGFSWIASESDRRTSTAIGRNIVAFWQLICLIKTAVEKEPENQAISPEHRDFDDV